MKQMINCIYLLLKWVNSLQIFNRPIHWWTKKYNIHGQRQQTKNGRKLHNNDREHVTLVIRNCKSVYRVAWYKHTTGVWCCVFHLLFFYKIQSKTWAAAIPSAEAATTSAIFFSSILDLYGLGLDIFDGNLILFGGTIGTSLLSCIYERLWGVLL